MYQAEIGEVGGINEYKRTKEQMGFIKLFIGHFDILVGAILVLGQWFSPSFLWIISSPWVWEGHHHRLFLPLSFGFSADSVDGSAVGSITL